VRLPEVFSHRDFNLYWAGVVFSEIGVRATVAANLYHVYQLTGSTVQVGFVGLFQAVALVVLSPIGGAYADRLDRRRLLQASQGLAMGVTLALAIATLSGVGEPWHIYVSVLLNTAAATFDRPARQALIPALVPRDQLVQAYAIVNPSREVAVLLGPALAGLLIAAAGPGLVYAFDAATYALLVVVLMLVRTPQMIPTDTRPTLLASIREAGGFIRRRPIIYQLMSLDLSATMFGAYRVLLPAFALEILAVGPTGYGLLSAAPAAGALLGSLWIFRLVKSANSGHVLLASTFSYGLACVALAQSRIFFVAVVAALALGVADALATTIRHAAVQLETPDEMRGRVTSLYQMASRGGPALGDVNLGAIAGALGPMAALSLGGLVPMIVASLYAVRGGTVRDYSVIQPEATAA
jgi:MFS family permease